MKKIIISITIIILFFVLVLTSIIVYRKLPKEVMTNKASKVSLLEIKEDLTNNLKVAQEKIHWKYIRNRCRYY